MGFWGRIGCTSKLVLYALLPGGGQAAGDGCGAAGGCATTGGGAAAAEAGEAACCAPRQIRCPDRFLDPRGQFSIFFPGCLAIAAPFVLFRLKRKGYSRCSAQASQQGLHVRGRR